MRFFAIILALISVTGTSAQSGRPTPAPSVSNIAATPVREPTVKELFDQANLYFKTKATEYHEKKVPYSESLQEKTKKEQMHLSAKNAAIAAARPDLTTDELFYIGRMYWLAANLDGTIEWLKKYIASDTAAADRRQASRALVVTSLAKQKKTADAEIVLADYMKNEPSRLSEWLRMETELAKAYILAAEFTRGGPHADEAYKSAKLQIKEAESRSIGIDLVIDTGMLVFEAYSGAGDRAKADAALDDMRATAKSLESPSFYYYAVDKKITYMIDTGRKTAAMEFFSRSRVDAARDFVAQTAQVDVINRLHRRETHYKLLGEPAPTFAMVDQWFPGKPRTFADLRGKVVLVDFWATWCGPCFEAFPAIIEWQQDFGKDGLEVLGVTRYYGMQVGMKDNPSEIEMLKGFRTKQSLPYDFVVAKDQTIQFQYGALSLPTAVLVDRKGLIRYIETGTSPTRLEELRTMIVKLLAEK